MSLVAVIANPAASQFTGGHHRDVMAELSKTHQVEALWPGSAHEASAAAEEAAANGADTVVAMGGDGMVHHVTQGLIDTSAALGIIPAGTTNVVARLLNVPSKPTRAARLIRQSTETRHIGTAKLILSRGETETVHHAMFACGFGLDAEVVRVADSDPYRKYRFGSIHYARSAVGVAMTGYGGREVISVSVGGETHQAGSVLIQFRSVYTYFGRLALKFNDDLPDPLSLLLVSGLKRRRIPEVALKAVTGRQLDSIAGFDVIEKVESVELDMASPVPAQADGEDLGLVDGAKATWAPDTLHIVV